MYQSFETPSSFAILIRGIAALTTRLASLIAFPLAVWWMLFHL